MSGLTGTEFQDSQQLEGCLRHVKPEHEHDAGAGKPDQGMGRILFPESSEVSLRVSTSLLNLRGARLHAARRRRRIENIRPDGHHGQALGTAFRNIRPNTSLKSELVSITWES